MNLLQRILYFPSQNFVHAEKRVNFVKKFSISTNNIITVESCQGKYGGTLDFIYERILLRPSNTGNFSLQKTSILQIT
jgi:hypothetical protein